jgi:hypothetical protein
MARVLDLIDKAGTASAAGIVWEATLDRLARCPAGLVGQTLGRGDTLDGAEDRRRRPQRGEKARQQRGWHLVANISQEACSADTHDPADSQGCSPSGTGGFSSARWRRG